jgi:Co/Zn/Cd efflux system component
MFHDLVDLSENLLSAWIANRARSSMNEKRVRRIGGAISISLIFASSTLMLYEAYEHLDVPYAIDLRVAIPLAIIGLLITIRQLIIHEGAPTEHRNVTHALQWLHLALDILGVTAALVGLILRSMGYAQADAWAALFIVALIWIRVAQVTYGLITSKDGGITITTTYLVGTIIAEPLRYLRVLLFIYRC